MDTLGSIKRPALGSSAALGSLYDARVDDFCGTSIFKKSIPHTPQPIPESGSTHFEYIYTEDFSEKTRKLDVSAGLTVSVLAGLCTLEGSGRYLSDHTTSAKIVKSSLIYNIKTKQESFSVFNEDLQEAYSTEALENGMPTHVVVAIEWGANSIITCQYENKDNRDVEKIKGELKADLDKLSLSIHGKGNFAIDQGKKSYNDKFEVKMYADILPQGEELPTTMEGAENLMKKLPTLVQASNDGKGNPLVYHLFPVNILQTKLKFKIQGNVVINSFEETSLVLVVQLFDKMKKVQQQLYDFYHDANKYGYCVPSGEFSKIADLKNKVQLQETSFRTELYTVLKTNRVEKANVSEKPDVCDLNKLINTIRSSGESPEKVMETLASWSNIMDRINFVRELEKVGATFIGIGSSLNEELVKKFDAKSYILYFSQDSKKDLETWGGNRQLFFQEMESKNQGHVFLVIDCDIHPCHKSKSAGSSCIQVVQSSKIMVHDLLEEQKQRRRISRVKTTNRAKQTLDRLPIIRAPLTLKCAGQNCNQLRMHDWHCEICMGIVEYGFDNHVYCKCGRTISEGLKFKCSDPKHGLTFVPHDDAYIRHILSALPPSGEINVLVVGETQEEIVAWMNEFVSFLEYDTLENFETAKQSSEDETLLKQQFEPGQNIYMFEFGSTKIRFIAGPEVIHTTDVNSNGQEMKKLIDSLYYLGGINAICMIFNPDSPNMNQMFKNNSNQLTNCFGQVKEKNFLFSVGGFGKDFKSALAQSMLAIKKLVSENSEKQIAVNNDTVYYFWGQSCRSASLSTQNSPTHVAKDEVESCQENSIQAQRMLKWIRQLRPISILNEVESVFSGGMKFCRDQKETKKFELAGSALKIGDGINIRGHFVGDEGSFGILLSESTEQSRNPLIVRTAMVEKIIDFASLSTWNGSESIGETEAHTPTPIVVGKTFEIRIMLEKDCFLILFDGKHFNAYKHRLPKRKINHIFLEVDKFFLTSIQVTRV